MSCAASPERCYIVAVILSVFLYLSAGWHVCSALNFHSKQAFFWLCVLCILHEVVFKLLFKATRLPHVIAKKLKWKYICQVLSNSFIARVQTTSSRMRCVSLHLMCFIHEACTSFDKTTRLFWNRYYSHTRLVIASQTCGAGLILNRCQDGLRDANSA